MIPPKFFWRNTAAFALLIPMLVASTGLAESVVRMHGAVTLEKLLAAQKAAIESQTGAKLEVVGNGSGRGLADLSGGLAEVALIGGSLRGVADATNQEKPGSVNPAGMQETPLFGIKLVIVTHPGVGVKSLTAAQLKDLLTGKIRSWKDVGGADLPVKVVLPFLGDGARISIQETILKDASFPKDAILRNSSKDLAVVLSQLPGSCSFLSIKNVTGDIASVPVDCDLIMPLALITKGEPAGDVKKVVDAAKALIK
jgi:phosphate transport system substrate-binding protein